MHLVEQRWDLLHFVDDDDLVRGHGVDNRFELVRSCAQAQEEIAAQQIEEQSPTVELTSDERALAGAAWTEKKVRACTYEIRQTKMTIEDLVLSGHSANQLSLIRINSNRVADSEKARRYVNTRNASPKMTIPIEMIRVIPKALPIDVAMRNDLDFVSVERGDSLSRIAARNHVRLDDFIRLNQHVKDNSGLIAVGQVLAIKKPTPVDGCDIAQRVKANGEDVNSFSAIFKRDISAREKLRLIQLQAEKMRKRGEGCPEP